MAVTNLTETLWDSYRGSQDMDARRQLLDRYLGLVHHTAREIARRSSQADVEELVSAGTVGLVHALEGFDPERGLAFSTYAMPRIRGAMLDELRERDWMPRTIRERSRKLHQIAAELAQKLGHPPDSAAMAAALGVDIDTYYHWRHEAETRSILPLDATTASDAEDDPHLAELIADPDAADPGDALQREEMEAALREGFTRLAQKDRTVLALYYFEELNLRQIGEVLHVTESRVSQIRTRALSRLREVIAIAEEDR